MRGIRVLEENYRGGEQRNDIFVFVCFLKKKNFEWESCRRLVMIVKKKPNYKEFKSSCIDCKILKLYFDLQLRLSQGPFYKFSFLNSMR